MNNTQKLMNIIPQLEVVEFMGLARVLKVKLYKDEKDEEGHFLPRTFTEVLNDIMKNFDKLDRKKKREILQLLKKVATKKISTESRWRAGPLPNQVQDSSIGKEGGAPQMEDK